jgi:hypothetical protein
VVRPATADPPGVGGGRGRWRRAFFRHPHESPYVFEPTFGVSKREEGRTMRRAMLLVAMMAVTLVVASGVALAVTKIGTNGPDRLMGTNGDDNLLGRGGQRQALQPGRRRHPAWRAWQGPGFRREGRGVLLRR